MTILRRSRLRIGAALVALVATACSSTLPDAASTDATRPPSTVEGSIDADVLDDSGRVLGHLRASVVDADGSGTFRAAPGTDASAQVVAVHADGGSLSVIGQHGLRLQASIDDGRLTGEGQLDSTSVRVRGAGGEQHPDISEGMRMLVVGEPSGEGYDALRELFEPIAYDADAHSRAELLDDREHFHGYAAIVFGPDVDPDALRTHELLHAFYGTGKWVVIAPATTDAQAVLNDLHSYSPGRPSAALAVRATGGRGGHDNVRPTVSYPQPPVEVTIGDHVSGAHLSPAEEDALAQQRAEWFGDQLLKFGRADMASANPGGPRALRNALTGAAGSVNFSLPPTAAAIEIAVPYHHTFTLTGSANGAVHAALAEPCGYDQKANTAWCPGSQRYQQAGADPLAACGGFLAAGYQMVDGELVQALSGNPSPPPEEYHPDLSGTPNHKLERPPYWSTFNMNPPGMKYGPSQCPKNLTQTGSVQGNDYYYAIFEPGFKQHTLVVLTDPTVNASDTSSLAIDNATNGTYVEVLANPDEGASHIVHVRDLKETMLYLGAYKHKIDIKSGLDPSTSDGQLTDLVFEYSGNKSFPTQTIEFTTETSSHSYTQDFNVGMFGDMAMGGYSQSVTESASVSVAVPNWKVSALADQRQVTYEWTTNRPLQWETIAANNMMNYTRGQPERDTGSIDGAPVIANWDLNDLNRSGFIPTSLTVWQGAETFGRFEISSQRTVHLVDHFSYFSPSKRGAKEAFWVTPITFDDTPDMVTPVTKDPVGAGINLCDPHVRAPDFKDRCVAMYGDN
jgi:hypothetical protein